MVVGARVRNTHRVLEVGTRRRRAICGEATALETDDAVAVEEPLAIRVDGDTIAVTMRTPGAVIRANS